MIFSTLILVTALNAEPKWVQTFSQEFEGARGKAPDPKVWNRDLGGGGFGNNELQTYTDGNKNAFLDGNGNLVIQARRETVTGTDGKTRDYTSARLKTQGLFSQTYGKFEARMKVPKGKGIWPAFWMLGENISKVSWPTCGEIDILEYLGHQVNTTYATLHGPGYSGGGGIQGKLELTKPLHEDFHVYSVEWEPEELRWYIDGKLYHKVTPDDLGANEWVFNQPQFLILNLAVGGNWPGNPDGTTVLPQSLLIDYVRAYKDENLKVDEAAIERRRKARIERASKEPEPGSINKLPGILPFANFLKGGQGVGYSDKDPQNQGGQFRTNDGVDIGFSGNSKYKYSVGWTGSGEWLKYAVEVEQDTTFNVEAIVASEGDGGTFHLELNGKSISDPIKVPNTGGWTSWTTVKAGKVSLPHGRNIVRVVLDTDGPQTKSIGNLLLLDFKK